MASRVRGRLDAIDGRIVISGQTFRIIGVAPERFSGTILGFIADLWIPAAAASALLFGLMPALDASRADVIPALKNGPSPAQPPRGWTHAMLAAARALRYE